MLALHQHTDKSSASSSSSSIESLEDDLDCDVEPPENEAEPIDIPRPATCLRPPCLKRTGSSPSQGSPLMHGASSPPAMSWSPPSSSSSGRSVSSPTPSTAQVYSYSFSTPRCFSATNSGTATPRHVHFDAEPPEAFDTHSAQDYDRSQIECTQGGSEFDLRLPSKCKRYNGDGEEEISEAEDDEDEGAFSETGSATSNSSFGRSPPLGVHGSTGWACLKRGSVIGGLSSRGNNSTDPSSTSTTGASELSSLPSRGLRTVGALSGRGILSCTAAPPSLFDERSGKLGSVDDSSGDDRTKTPSSNSVSQQSSTSDVDEDDGGAAAFEAAVLARHSTKSPDATPKPSPSIVPRWARCTDYFAEPAVEDHEVKPATMSLSAVEASPEARSLEGASRDAEVHDSRRSPPSSESSSRGGDASASTSVEHTPKMSPSSSAALSPLLVDTVRDGSPPAASRIDIDAGPASSSSPLVDTLAATPVPANETMSRRPSLNRPQAFSGVSAAETNAVTAASAPLDAQHDSASSASPLSSRCSSVEPTYHPQLWSSSSCGETISDEGATTPSSNSSTTNINSPSAFAVTQGGEWSSCTSPDVGPVKTVVAVTGQDQGNAVDKTPMLQHHSSSQAAQGLHPNEDEAGSAGSPSQESDPSTITQQHHFADGLTVDSDVSSTTLPASPYSHSDGVPVLSKAISRMQMLQRTDSSTSSRSDHSPLAGTSSADEEAVASHDDELGLPATSHRKYRSESASASGSRTSSRKCSATSSTSSSRRPSSSSSPAATAAAAARKARFWGSETDASSPHIRQWGSVAMEASSSADSAMSASGSRSASGSGTGSGGLCSPSYEAAPTMHDEEDTVASLGFGRRAASTSSSSDDKKERRRKSSSSSRSRKERERERAEACSLADDEDAGSFFPRSTTSRGSSRGRKATAGASLGSSSSFSSSAFEDEGALGGF